MFMWSIACGRTGAESEMNSNRLSAYNLVLSSLVLIVIPLRMRASSSMAMARK